MKVHYYFLTLLSIAGYIFFNYFSKEPFVLCEVEKCPFCYGKNLCDSFKNNKITLQSDSITKFISNYLSVKNVYFAKLVEDDVVLKKLAHNSELKTFDDYLKLRRDREVTERELLQILTDGEPKKNFKSCNHQTSLNFLKYFYKNTTKTRENLLTLININVEPLLLEIFIDNNEVWPVPKIYGYCGRVVVVEDCGNPLNSLQHYDWFDRAYVAYQLLIAAGKFTDYHADFRFYLTDVSPDNVVVDSELKVAFVDLGNVVLLRKNKIVSTKHYTTHSNSENFIFSENEICEADISDHNIYAVCWLLLSTIAPWPMMKSGLLHSPPVVVLKNYKDLFKNIELCVNSNEKLSRFILSDKIVHSLENILVEYKKHKIR